MTYNPFLKVSGGKQVLMVVVVGVVVGMAVAVHNLAVLVGVFMDEVHRKEEAGVGEDLLRRA